VSTLRGRVCLVTGATDGHGRAVARELARRGAELVLHGRDPEKTRRVQAEISAENGGRRPEILLCDLASREAIDQAAKDWLARGRPLHVLVNNAGLVSQARVENAEGNELTFAVNYLALFQLTLRLLPRLLESAPARIVNVSSDTYRMAKLDFDDLQTKRGYSFMRAYGRSKLAIVYFTLALALRLEGRGVTVNAVDPGPVASNIGANNRGFAYRIAGPIIKKLFPSADRAARTAVMLAADPALEGATGGYYRSLRRREHPLEFDAALSDRLWRTSAELTKVDL
jgi:NAD(P)-dependent dehydrogenase (short-subunit alcohol dehydrogenase family)